MHVPSPRSHRRSRSLASIVVLGLALAACGGDDDGGGAAAVDATEVMIRLVAFKPDRIEVDAGTTVRWVNEDPGAHTVTSGTVEDGASSVTPDPDGAFESGELATDESFEQAFDEPGMYSFYCELHPATMRGVVVVG